MSISLTWANYALIMSVCLVVYYLMVFFFYCKRFNLFYKHEASVTSNPLPDLYADEITSGRQKNVNLFGEEIEDESLPEHSDEPDFTPDAQDFAMRYKLILLHAMMTLIRKN